MTVASHWLSLSSWIVQNPMLRSRMEMKVSPLTVRIISWIKGSRNGYRHRSRFNMQKSVTNWICLFFLGTAKPCAAHLELFVLQRTPILHSFLTSLFYRGRSRHWTWYGLPWYGLALGSVCSRWTGLQGNFPSILENRMECFFNICQRARHCAWLRWVGIMSSRFFAW
jgi:hypothetical protein